MFRNEKSVREEKKRVMDNNLLGVIDVVVASPRYSLFSLLFFFSFFVISCVSSQHCKTQKMVINLNI